MASSPHQNGNARVLARQRTQNYRKCTRSSPDDPNYDPDHVCIMGAEVWKQLRKFAPQLQKHAVKRCFELGEWNFCTAHDTVTEICIRLDGGETPSELILRDQTPQRFGTRE